MSIWLWLYFVVTIFLSTLIFIWWYLTARHKVQKIDNAFGAVDEKLGVELELNRPRASDEKKIV